MAAVVVIPSDLEPFAVIDEAKALAMIEDALAMAALVAPCINDEDFAYPEAAKAVIRRAILRWHEAGSGATVQQTVGPFGQSTETRPSRGLFWPTEINELAGLCSTSAAGAAFQVDTTPLNLADEGYWSSPTVWVPIP